MLVYITNNILTSRDSKSNQWLISMPAEDRIGLIKISSKHKMALNQRVHIQFSKLETKEFII